MTNRNLLCLPVEIVQHILDRCDTYTVFHSIRYVCKHFYDLVNNYQTRQLVFLPQLPYKLKLIFSLSPIELLTSLEISNGEKGRLIEQCISHIGNRRLVRLRHLSLYQVTEKELNYFLDNLLPSTLVSLTIEWRFYQYSLNPIISIINQVNLKKLCLLNFNDVINNRIWSKHNTIEHLTVGSCSFRDIEIILNSMPQLKQLIIGQYQSQFNATVLSNSDFDVQSQLQSLILTIDHSYLHKYDMERLFSLVPSIEHLKLIIKHLSSEWIFDGRSWEDLLSSKLLRLNNFEFVFSCVLTENEHNPLLGKYITSFQTPYWLEKQCFVTGEYHINPRQFIIYRSNVPFVHQSILSRQSSLFFKYSSQDKIYQLMKLTPDGHVSFSSLNIYDFSNYANRKGIMHYIFKLLETNETVQSLNLSGNQLNTYETSRLDNALRNNSTLQTLDLTGNLMKGGHMKYLVNILIINQTLTELTLNYNKFGTADTILLLDALRINKGLTKLDLENNQIGSDIGQHLCAMLRENQTLRELKLSFNQIGSEGMKAIASGLKQNTSLTTLIIRKSDIGPSAEFCFRDLFKENQTLRVLDLSLNGIGSEGLKNFADGLQQNKSLTTLDISQTQFGAEGAAYLADALKQNTTLTSLIMKHNGFGQIGTEYFANALHHNQTLTLLNLHGHRMGHEGALYLASALKTNTTLIQLILNHCQIGDKGAQHLATALTINTTLKILNLENENFISNEGIQYFIDVVNNKMEPITITLDSRIISNSVR